MYSGAGISQQAIEVPRKQIRPDMSIQCASYSVVRAAQGLLSPTRFRQLVVDLMGLLLPALLVSC